jgi:hypothetical protein
VEGLLIASLPLVAFGRLSCIQKNDGRPDKTEMPFDYQFNSSRSWLLAEKIRSIPEPARDTISSTAEDV